VKPLSSGFFFDGEIMDIASLREEIDKIDEKILALLEQRARLAAEIGKKKLENNLSVVSIEREKEIIQRLVEKNNSRLTGQDIKAIFKEIIKSCRNVQIE
jgi:chorismate mutase/prephenate dehydratase